MDKSIYFCKGHKRGGGIPPASANFDGKTLYNSLFIYYNITHGFIWMPTRGQKKIGYIMGEWILSGDFPRTLSLLRRERGISQRAAAQDLGMSQALLSHYETGAREPGLSFVVKVCDYYQVSADFLLGRTLVRDGAALDPDTLFDASEDKRNSLRGQSAAAMMGRKMAVNAISLLYELAGQTGITAVVSEMTNFFGGGVYRMFRHLYSVAGKDPERFFSIPTMSYISAASADMAQSEAKLLGALHNPKATLKLPEFSGESLTEQYPQIAKSLLTLTHQAGDRCAKRM